MGGVGGWGLGHDDCDGAVSLGKGQDVGSWRLCSGMWGPVGSNPGGIHRNFLVA